MFKTAAFKLLLVIDDCTPLCRKWDFACCGQTCMRSAAPGAAPFCGPACSTVYTGTLDGLQKIARTEGLATLWRGTDVALMMAIPMVMSLDSCPFEIACEFGGLGGWVQ